MFFLSFFFTASDMQIGHPHLQQQQFPRTVPRTASLPRGSHSSRGHMITTPTNSTNTLQSRTTATGEQIPMMTHIGGPGGDAGGGGGQVNMHPSYSFDR